MCSDNCVGLANEMCDECACQPVSESDIIHMSLAEQNGVADYNDE